MWKEALVNDMHIGVLFFFFFVSYSGATERNPLYRLNAKFEFFFFFNPTTYQ